MAKIQKETNLPNRRRLASLEGCKKDLKEDLLKIFMAFNEALVNFEVEVLQTPIEARARAFEASLLNSKMIASIQKNFPNHWKFGKYKRFILRINGYLFLFKKLNNADKPMNIKTKTVSAIAEQLSFPLFDSDSFVEEPILFFGYKKNKFGGITDPKLVYIDEDQVQWTIDRKDLEEGSSGLLIGVNPPNSPSPSVKKSALIKRAVNN